MKTTNDAVATIALIVTLTIFIVATSVLYTRDSAMASRIAVLERLVIDSRQQLQIDNKTQDIRLNTIELSVADTKADVAKLKKAGR